MVKRGKSNAFAPCNGIEHFKRGRLCIGRCFIAQADACARWCTMIIRLCFDLQPKVAPVHAFKLGVRIRRGYILIPFMPYADA